MLVFGVKKKHLTKNLKHFRTLFLLRDYPGSRGFLFRREETRQEREREAGSSLRKPFRCVVIGCLLIDLVILIDSYRSMIVRFSSPAARGFLSPLLSLSWGFLALRGSSLRKPLAARVVQDKLAVSPIIPSAPKRSSRQFIFHRKCVSFEWYL